MVTSVQSRAQQNVDPSKTSTDLLSSWLCWPLLKNWHRTHNLGTLPLGFGWNHHIQVSYLNLETTNFFFLALVSVFIYFVSWNVTVCLRAQWNEYLVILPWCNFLVQSGAYYISFCFSNLGETFIFFNKQIKGNKREIIQLGGRYFNLPQRKLIVCSEDSVPRFLQLAYTGKHMPFVHSIFVWLCHLKTLKCLVNYVTNVLFFSLSTGHTEPIPLVLQSVIDHLVLWRLIPESRKPNSVIINFFDEVDVDVLLLYK